MEEAYKSPRHRSDHSFLLFLILILLVLADNF